MNVIETHNLTKYYGATRGIEQLNLDLKGGEILGFIGPNGAGKTTTIRILLSLIYPTSGSAKIFGKDAIEYGPEIRRDIGYMPAEVFYYENMRVKELLEYSASFYRQDCSQRIREISSLLKLDLDKKIDDLSYGNKKKVGIVQGLLHSPKLLILDEPTGGLDPLIQKSFFELLRHENESGTSIFFSSHILSEVQKLCHRVAIIKDGRLIKVESMAKLAKESYKKISLELSRAVTKKHFSQPGISNLQVKDKHVSFLYRGDINTISRLVSGLSLSDLLIEEPDLEEIFMHYYK